MTDQLNPIPSAPNPSPNGGSAPKGSREPLPFDDENEAEFEYGPPVTTSETKLAVAIVARLVTRGFMPLDLEDDDDVTAFVDAMRETRDAIRETMRHVDLVALERLADDGAI